MRITIVSDHESRGGAATAATRLAAGLRDLGHAVHRIAAFPDPAATPPADRLGGFGVPHAVAWRVPTWTRGDRVGRPIVNERLRRLLADAQPDAVNLHNLHGAFHLGWSAQFLDVAEEHGPTMWTMHDMWSFTGRCAYNGDCPKFVSGCDADCPTPDEYPALAPSRIAGEWSLRSTMIDSSHRATAVAPSRWLCAQAEAGVWAGRVVRIPYGLPLDVFTPHPRDAARAELGWPTDDHVVLTSAVDLGDPRKGASVLARALETVSVPLTLVTMGENTVAVDNANVGVRSLGTVSDPRCQALVYSAADVLVHPALADNLPLVVQESIACGTPVVAFDVGGLGDMVRPGRTGWLADRDTSALADALQEAVTSRPEGLQEACREVATSEWGLELQAQRYVDLVTSAPSVRGPA